MNMSDNKLVKTITDAAVLTGLAAGIGWIAKKVLKENFTSDPSSNVMNYVNSPPSWLAALRSNSTSRTKTTFPLAPEINDLKKSL